jgi:hypothetical protein
MLSSKILGASLATFAALTFVLCVLFGLILPAVHMEGFLEATLPGFRWLTAPGFLLGVVETALIGGYAGALFAPIYNVWFLRLGAVGSGPDMKGGA